MKKIFFILFGMLLVVGLTSNQIFAQAQYLINGSNPLALTLEELSPK